MKKPTLIAAQLALFMAAAVAVQAADETLTYTAKPGSKVRIEGTANAIHTVWFVQGTTIAGHLEVRPGFPIEPGQAVTPGKVQAQATNVYVSVRSLKSKEADGRSYSDAMDGVMYDHLKADKFDYITFRLSELVLKEAAKAKDAPYLFDVKGDLTVGGVTKPISMPVNILPLQGKEGKELQITGTVPLKMSDFKVGPVEKTILGIGLKSGDFVKVTIDWKLRQWKPAPRAASK